MKQVYSYLEIGHRIDTGQQVAFTSPATVRVTAVQKSRESDSITVTMQFFIRDTCIGILEYEYSTILALLEAFDIDDLSEIWEVLA